jgi:phytoene dehydrogenase-like protein
VFAEQFARTIEAAGGELRASAEVEAVRVSDERVQGVTLASGVQIDAPCVISDIGIRNTLRLLP